MAERTRSEGQRTGEQPQGSRLKVVSSKGLIWDELADSAPHVYTNISEVGMSLRDLQIRFGVMTGVSEQGTREAHRVVTVYMTLAEAKALSAVLTRNITAFEDQIAPIETPQITDEQVSNLADSAGDST